MHREQQDLRKSEAQAAPFVQAFRQRRCEVWAEAEAQAPGTRRAEANGPMRLAERHPTGQCKVVLSAGRLDLAFEHSPAVVWAYSPRRRVSARWTSVGGEEHGVREVLRKLWLQYLAIQGLPATCPWCGLLSPGQEA